MPLFDKTIAKIEPVRDPPPLDLQGLIRVTINNTNVYYFINCTFINATINRWCVHILISNMTNKRSRQA